MTDRTRSEPGLSSFPALAAPAPSKDEITDARWTVLPVGR
jgi:hypothetical protein